jgi:hypothetical protein
MLQLLLQRLLRLCAELLCKLLHTLRQLLLHLLLHVALLQLLCKVLQLLQELLHVWFQRHVLLLVLLVQLKHRRLCSSCCTGNVCRQVCKEGLLCCIGQHA